MHSTIIGCGSYLPSRILTNHDLAKEIDTSDEWITTRTGIKQRHIAAKDEATSDLAIQAAKAALESAACAAEEIDFIIVATTTADRSFPAVAVRVQKELAIKEGPAFDVQAVCAGFVYALTVADALIKTGTVTCGLVIGAEKMSSLLNWEDRSTAVLFGDGAGAVVLKASEDKNSGILASNLHADGHHQDILQASGGISTTGTSGAVEMKGKEVFKHAVEYMTSSAKEALDQAGLSVEDIDWFIPHQANTRILERVGKSLGLPTEKLVSTVPLHANTSAASIPLALSHALGKGKIKKGDLLVLSAIGGGLAWGTVALRW